MVISSVATVSGVSGEVAVLRLASEARRFHYLTHLLIYRVATLSLASSALLTITTTNLGALAGDVSNGISAFSKVTDVDLAFPGGLRSTTLGAAATIDFPAPGLGAAWRGIAIYHTGH